MINRMIKMCLLAPTTAVDGVRLAGADAPGHRLEPGL